MPFIRVTDLFFVSKRTALAAALILSSSAVASAVEPRDALVELLPIVPHRTKPSVDCGGMSSEECAMFNAINKVRVKKGRAALGIHSKCVVAADAHAEAMVAFNFFDHDAPHEGWSRRMARFGLSRSSAGENIAYGPGSIEKIVRLWMNSPGHRKNILGRYSSTGIGVAHDDEGRRYWVQCFSGLPGDL